MSGPSPVIAFVDTETTGLDPSKEEVIDVHVELWNMGAREVVYSKRFFPCGPCDPDAARINGYTPVRWSELGAVGPLLASDAQEIGVALAKGDLLGGAATSFDRDMLQGAFRRVRVPWPKVSHRLVDVQSLAAPFLIAGKIQSVSLAALAYYFLGVGSVPHTAAGDIDLTIRVFEKLLDSYCGAIFAPEQGAAA